MSVITAEKSNVMTKSHKLIGTIEYLMLLVRCLINPCHTTGFDNTLLKLWPRY